MPANEHLTYRLSPAYDLINTRLHVDDSDFALDKGLFDDDFKSESYKKFGHPSQRDFRELVRRVGVQESRIDTLLHPFLTKQPFVETLVNSCFLTDANEQGYLLLYNTKRNHLLAT